MLLLSIYSSDPLAHTDTPMNHLDPTLNLPPAPSTHSQHDYAVLLSYEYCLGLERFCSCSLRAQIFCLPPAERSDLSPWKRIMKCLGATFGTNCHPQTNAHALRLTLAAEITVFVALSLLQYSHAPVLLNNKPPTQSPPENPAQE